MPYSNDGLVVVAGGTGYVGAEFLRQLGSDGINLSRSECNNYDRASLRRVLLQLQPQFLVNCAGYTGKPNVDACELHQSECLEGNAVLPSILAEVCSELKIPWGHVSSGCIFLGSKPGKQGFRETDLPNFTFRQKNCSFYSGTKALGEELLGYTPTFRSGEWTWEHRATPENYIWRLRIPFSELAGPRNYLTKVLNYPRLLDVENSISHVREFVTTALLTWKNRLPFGIYHLTNPGYVSTREVTEMIREVLPSARDKFEFFESEEEFLRIAAKTPRSSCILDTSKIESYGLGMTPVREALLRALKNWKS